MDQALRLLAPDDWRLWRSVRLRSLADAPDAFGSTLAREQAFTEQDWRERLLSGPVVVIEERAPAACGAAFADGPDLFHVVAMWTAPEARGSGLAGRVLRVLLEEAAGSGRRPVLDVTRGNDAARRLYERFGFRATGEARPLREGSSLMVERMALPDG